MPPLTGCPTSHCSDFTPLSGGTGRFCTIHSARICTRYLPQPPERRANKRMTCEKFDGSPIAVPLLIVDNYRRSASPAALVVTCPLVSANNPAVKSQVFTLFRRNICNYVFFLCTSRHDSCQALSMAILVSRFGGRFYATRQVAWLRQLGEFITIIITSCFHYLVFVISMYVHYIL